MSFGAMKRGKCTPRDTAFSSLMTVGYFPDMETAGVFQKRITEVLDSKRLGPKSPKVLSFHLTSTDHGEGFVYQTEVCGEHKEIAAAVKGEYTAAKVYFDPLQVPAQEWWKEVLKGGRKASY